MISKVNEKFFVYKGEIKEFPYMYRRTGITVAIHRFQGGVPEGKKRVILRETKSVQLMNVGDLVPIGVIT